MVRGAVSDGRGQEFGLVTRYFGGTDRIQVSEVGMIDGCTNTINNNYFLKKN
jgi:hypothetical protein